MKLLKTAAVLLALTSAASVSAATFVVRAKENSTTGGTFLPTGLTFKAGDFFRVGSSTNDLWSAGGLPRHSDGNGLIGDRFATPQDDSGYAPGTQIGSNFGQYMQTIGFTDVFGPYGVLVGAFYNTNGAPPSVTVLGANGIFEAAADGELRLGYLDSNNDDNFGEIAFKVTAVPEPASWAMLIGGFGLLGTALRRRRNTRVVYA